METGETNQKTDNKNNKKKETAQLDYFKSLEFEQFYLQRKYNYMKKCNKCRQNFDGENYVIAFKLMVPKRETKLQDGHLTEGTVHIHVRNDCMEKAKCNPSEIIICGFYKLTSIELAKLAERGQFKF